MQNCVVVFTFSVLEGKYPFWANLVRKIKNFTLSWSLVPRLIRISRIQWWCSLFLFSTRKTLFQKLKIVSLSWDLVPRLIQICRIQWWCSYFLFCWKLRFLVKFGRQIQNCLKRNLVPRLTRICRRSNLVLRLISICIVHC